MMTYNKFNFIKNKIGSRYYNNKNIVKRNYLKARLGIKAILHLYNLFSN